MGSPGAGPRPSTRFGPYELQELIGLGGMGEVYRAYDTVRQRTVALKLLRTDVAADQSYRDRFRRESRVAARLQEPHVIPVHDFGEIDGVLFIDMRLVEGPSVKAELGATGGLVPARAVSIIGQVAAALDAAHASGLVHRDIKPENVLLTADDFAYLVDFGIANGGGEATVTRTGLIIGSCAYMAPERLNGEPGGPPSDVYSLTCLLFECLTGRPPFEAEDIRQIMSAHMFAPPPRPSELRQGISPAFDDVVARGMAKNPTERFASAGELARAAAAAVQGRSVAARPGPPHNTRRFPAERQRPPAPLPSAPVKHSRFSRTQWALLAGTLALFAVAAVLAVAIVFVGGSSSTSGPASTLAAPAPSATDSTTTSTTSPTSTTSAAPISGVSGTDAQGFIGHAARCDAGSSLTAAIRTASSLAVVCQTASGSYYYHGERLRDGANVELAGAVPTDGGFDATNPADGARYQVRPDELTILSNGHVDSAERALEYGSAD